MSLANGFPLEQYASTRARAITKYQRCEKKGGAEARAIVAMLARDARESKNRYSNAFTNDLKSIYAVYYNAHFKSYEKAKAMLK